jgi:hypothetical protein
MSCHQVHADPPLNQDYKCFKSRTARLYCRKIRADFKTYGIDRSLYLRVPRFSPLRSRICLCMYSLFLVNNTSFFAAFVWWDLNESTAMHTLMTWSIRISIVQIRKVFRLFIDYVKKIDSLDTVPV